MQDLERLLRWQRAGGTWEVVGRRGDELTISLCRCDGGEEADRFATADPQVRAYIEAQSG